MKNPFSFWAVILLILVVFCTPVFAGDNRIHDNTSVVSLVSADVRAATYTSNDVNVRAYRGQGKIVLDAEAQGSGITNTCKVQESKLYTGATNTYAGDTDRPLNKSTGGKTKLAAKFTQSGARQIKYVDLKLKQVGTVAADKVLTLTIEGDSSGPDGNAAGTAGTVLAGGIDDSYQTVRFTFTTPVTVADSTDYWIVLTSNYTASDTNYIDWQTTTVESGGLLSAYAPSSWSAVTTENAQFTVYQLNFADNVAFTAVGNTAAVQSKGIELDTVGGYVRAVCTVAGGSSTGAYSMVLVAPN